MREEVRAFVALGPLPDQKADEQVIEQYERLLLQISRPVSDEEARVLVGMFGPDDCYGLAWTLLHLIETAPNWPLVDVLQNNGNEWVQRLRGRAERAGLL
jgi:hypothetical protein